MQSVNQGLILNGILDSGNIEGLTHRFYNYPARFSPTYARSIIESFTNPGDLVMDPFMGGGTSVIEALALKRKAVGLDINKLAYFVTKAKTTILTNKELNEFRDKAYSIISQTNIWQKVNVVDDWFDTGSLKNLDSKDTWRIRKYISLLKANFKSDNDKIITVFSCVLLKAGQWAFDNRKHIPSLSDFRNKIQDLINQFYYDLIELRKTLDGFQITGTNFKILNRSVVGIEKDISLERFYPPRLILTSPPYPGTHILYHRWQIKGRKETSAPYWIANIEDGHGATYYTFGSRHQKELLDYFRIQYEAFRSLSQIIDDNTIVVQILSFSHPNWQLAKYLKVMENSGFREIDLLSQSKTKISRIWRDVPSRKWYTQINDTSSESKEVVLAHKLF